VSGVEAGLLLAVLLDEPDLIAAQQAAVKDAGVVGGEDQLRAMRVGGRVMEQAEKVAHQRRLQAGVEFVDQHATVLQHAQRTDQALSLDAIASRPANNEEDWSC
jgi:hypothetical protein